MTTSKKRAAASSSSKKHAAPAEQKDGGTIVDATVAEPADLVPTDTGDGDHYCPGCGRRSNGEATCTGSPAGPHQPIQTVPVSELKKDPAKHTPAPPSE